MTVFTQVFYTMPEYRRNKEPLLESSQFVKGVGPSRQVLLSKLGIETVEDLLLHFPRRYYDRRQIIKISQAAIGKESTFIATVLAVSLRKTRKGQSVLTVAVGDETGNVELVFFNQPYLEKRFRPGERIIISGAVNVYGGRKQVVSPEYEIFSGELDDSLIHTGRIVPIYPLTSGISQRMMRKIISAAIEKCSGRIKENLNPRLVLDEDLPTREEAFRQIHYPDSLEQVERARRRFKFEEVFFLHILLKSRRGNLLLKKQRPCIPPPHPVFEEFIASLPFELTAAQRKVLGEIVRDVEGRGLNRLLQGDVGSGKTIVAIASMVLAVEKGFQAAMMVPTEILAVQHFERIKSYMKGFPYRIAFLIGSLGAQEKRKTQEAIEAQEVDIVVGTHALIQESITFHELGLAVIDEQHRFGVKQRATLGMGKLLPHFLVMTATPIPRSLAQTIYGDLDLSIIDELPVGERRVRTELIMSEERERVFEELEKAFCMGKQAFILYPVIEESSRTDLLPAIEQFEYLQTERFKNYPLGLLHGRMSFDEKRRAIELFRKGDIAALVTTTVIEVGIDIPNANILVVNNPERFGLAQLHQLRGRVGRGGDEGVCYLVLSSEAGPQAIERLTFFASTNDGFQVAEEDLRLRGPGEIWGLKQSGYPSFRVLNPLTDAELIKRSWEESSRILKHDPKLQYRENRQVADYFYNHYKPKMEIAEIG